MESFHAVVCIYTQQVRACGHIVEINARLYLPELRRCLAGVYYLAQHVGNVEINIISAGSSQRSAQGKATAVRVREQCQLIVALNYTMRTQEVVDNNMITHRRRRRSALAWRVTVNHAPERIAFVYSSSVRRI